MCFSLTPAGAGAGDSPSPLPPTLAASSRFVLWKSPDFPLLPAVPLCRAEDDGGFSHYPSPRTLAGWDIPTQGPPPSLPCQPGCATTVTLHVGCGFAGAAICPCRGLCPVLSKAGTAALPLPSRIQLRLFCLPSRQSSHGEIAGLMARMRSQERVVKPGLAAVLAGCSLSHRNPPEVRGAKLSGQSLLAPGRLFLPASVMGGEPGCSLPGHRGGS